MLVQIVDKQRRAVSVVKTALFNAGISNRSVCISFSNQSCRYGDDTLSFAVFVSAPNGCDIEPFYETGVTLVEAVRKMIFSIRGGKVNSTKNGDHSDLAPF